LEAEGARFQSESDTEVLLHLYHRDGAGMVERLRGMFALAIWDEARRGMLLARDPFGIKPLYYADDGRSLRIASQVKALRAGGRAGSGVNAAGHVGFFLMGVVPEPHTLYADIKALPAGSTLWVDENGPAAPRRYYDLAARLRQPPEITATDLREALLDSVRHHFVSDIEVGVFLSAGLDSTTLTGLASEIKGAELRTLTLAFDEYTGTAQDEAPLARRVADLYGTRHHEVRLQADEFAAERDNLLTAMDQPTVDGVNVYFVARAAAQAGLKVVLSGTGGDELFAGYNVFERVPATHRAMRLIHTPGPVGWAAGAAARLRSLRHPSPKKSGLFKFEPTVRNVYTLLRGIYMPWELDRCLDPDLARVGLAELDLYGGIDTQDAASDDVSRARVTAFEAGLYMRNQLLRDGDWAGMAHSLEIRVPLVDRVLYEHVLPALHGPRPPLKRDLAGTPARSLPDAVLNRRKTGFHVPMTRWLPGVQSAHNFDLRGWSRVVYESFVR